MHLRPTPASAYCFTQELPACAHKKVKPELLEGQNVVKISTLLYKTVYSTVHFQIRQDRYFTRALYYTSLILHQPYITPALYYTGPVLHWPYITPALYYTGPILHLSITPHLQPNN